MGKQARAINAQGRPELITLTASPLQIDAQTATAIVECDSATNVDSLQTQWVRGRRILIKSAAGSANTMTFRDNQSGTNLVLNSTSVAVGTNDSIEFIADLSAAGAEMWYQIRGLADIS